MSRYYVTFGQKYRQEQHPVLGAAYGCAVPDGWVVFEADDEAQARNKIFAALGHAWAFVYDEEDWCADWYSLGEMSLEAQGG